MSDLEDAGVYRWQCSCADGLLPESIRLDAYAVFNFVIEEFCKRDIRTILLSRTLLCKGRYDVLSTKEAMHANRSTSLQTSHVKCSLCRDRTQICLQKALDPVSVAMSRLSDKFVHPM